jgi:phosphoglycerate kinase
MYQAIKMRFIKDAPENLLRGRALVRIDLNSKDDWRIISATKTLKLLSAKAVGVLILSHAGRPDIKNVNDIKKLSLKSKTKTLSKILNKPVHFLPNIAEAENKFINCKKGEIFLLENLRFDSGEEKNDPSLAKKLASLGDYYVNEAFPVSHRANASVEAITRYIPSFAGFGFEAEVNNLSKVIANPKKPLVVILGGGKSADKVGIINNLSKITKWFLLGGASANTLLYLRGHDIGSSLRETDPKNLKSMKSLLKLESVLLPFDCRKEKDAVLDIGDLTAKEYESKIKEAKTIVWAGPLGLFEKNKFAKGSTRIAKAIGANNDSFSIVGGGETVEFLRKNKLDKYFDFVSTGGGAMLEFLAGKKLPGIEALNKYGKTNRAQKIK